jgi:hypothetical protein
MAGIASSTAETYAKFNIPSIPLGAKKRPAVKGFKIASLTVDQSRGFHRIRPDANALGVPDGALSGIVRLDIDERGDNIVTEVIRRAGDTPAKVRTASGKWHLLYADNDERRLTGAPGKANARPWDDLKVDLCGRGGYSVSPPSECNGGTYQLIGMSLEDMLVNRHRLPKIQGLQSRAYITKEAPPAPANDVEPESIRADLLWSTDDDLFPAVARICKRVWPAGGTKDDAMAEAMRYNAQFKFPRDESAVRAKVNYCWDMTVAGKNRFGAGEEQRGAWLAQDHINQLIHDPPLLALICWLKAKNGPDAEFWVADGLAEAHLGWSARQLSPVRQRALESGWLEMIVPRAKGRNALYRWGHAAGNLDPRKV